MAILHFIKDEEDPAGIVATLRDSLPAGSYLALSHGTLDFHPPGDAATAAAGYKNATARWCCAAVSGCHRSSTGSTCLVTPPLVSSPSSVRPESEHPPRAARAAETGVHAMFDSLDDQAVRAAHDAARVPYDNHRALGLDVLAVKLDTLRVDLAVELENRGKPLAPDGEQSAPTG